METGGLASMSPSTARNNNSSLMELLMDGIPNLNGSASVEAFHVLSHVGDEKHFDIH